MARPTDKDREYEAKKLLESLGYNMEHESYYTCNCCGKSKSLKQNNYYQTNNPMYLGCKVSYEAPDKNGGIVRLNHSVLPFCKTCIEKMYKQFCIQTRDNKKLAAYKLLQELRLPWIEALWDISCSSKTEGWKLLIGKQNSLPQYSDLTIKDSEPYVGEDTELEEEFEIKRKKLSKPKKEELVIKWGNYDTDVLYRFEEKYEFLKNNYKEQTNMHTEALFRYVRYAVLEQIANESGDTGGAKTYNDLANKAATAAKINPSQLSKSDLTDGLNSFSELSLAVEKAVDIVRILPKFKFRPNDALDFTIWCYINYERNLNGLPEVPYEDVYKFYDRKVEEYIEQYGDPYGMFSNDTTKINREAVKNFIKPFNEDGD